MDSRLGARRGGGAAARQAGGLATRETWPINQTTPSFLRPRAPVNSSEHLKTRQEYRARLVLRGLSESERSGTYIFLNITKPTLVQFKPLTVRAGISDSNKARPQRGLVLPCRPHNAGQCPTSCVELQGPGASAHGLDDAARLAALEHPKMRKDVA